MINTLRSDPGRPGVNSIREEAESGGARRWATRRLTDKVKDALA